MSLSFSMIGQVLKLSVRSSSLKKLYWSSNDMLTLASPDEFYVLQYKKEVKISFSIQKITNFYHN